MFLDFFHFVSIRRILYVCFSCSISLLQIKIFISIQYSKQRTVAYYTLKEKIPIITAKNNTSTNIYKKNTRNTIQTKENTNKTHPHWFLWLTAAPNLNHYHLRFRKCSLHSSHCGRSFHGTGNGIAKRRRGDNAGGGSDLSFGVVVRHYGGFVRVFFL